MADRDKVDELVIELTARDKATEKIDNLARSLRGLGDSLTVGLGSSKLNSVANSLKSITVATQELGRSTRAINNLPKLTTELSNMMNSLHNAPSISKDVLSLAHALSKIDGSAIKGFSKIASPKVKTDSNVQEMKALENEEQKVDSQTKEVTKSFNGFGNAVRNALKGVPSTLGKLSKLDIGKTANKLNSVIGKIGNLGKKVASLYKNVSLTHKLSNMSFKKSFTSLLRYTVGIRSLFVLANRIRSSIEDGNKNLAKYSDTFNKSMSLYKSGLGTMKNAMSVAFAPLVNYFSSAVNRIIDSFINAFNTIARLMARLTGAKQVVQATRYYNDFGDSLGKAGKNAKDLTTGIDELNILNDQSGGGSGGASTGVQDMFETVDVTTEFDSWIDKMKSMWDKADFTDLGTTLADKINGALQNIDWEKIQGNARKLGKSLATFLNGVFEEELNGQTFGFTIGKTIGEAVNTGIEFSYAFVTNFHWDSFGQAIADGIKGALETIEWRKWAETLHGLVNGLLETLTTLFSDEQMWQDLGRAIGQFFSGISWSETWFNFKGMVKALAKGIKTALQEWKETDSESFNIALTLGIAIAGIKLVSAGSKIAWSILGSSIMKQIGEAILANGIGATILDVGSIMLPIGITLVVSLVAIKFANWLQTKNEFGHTSFQKITDLIQFKDQSVDWNGNECTYSVTLTEKFKDWKVDYQQWIYNTGVAWDDIKETTKTKLQELKEYIAISWENIKENSGSALETLRGNVSSKWEEIKNNTSYNWNNIKDSLASIWSRVKEDGRSKFTDLKETISTKWNEVKTNSGTIWETIKSTLSTKWSGIKTDGSTKFTQLKTNVVSAFTGIKNGIKAPINSIIGFVESMVNKIVDGVNFISDKIKEFTTFSWTNPITGTEYKSDGISLPKVQPISIPRLADGGYVPNTNMGSLFWAGENGAEIVANASGGTEVLNATQVASAVSSGVRQAIIDAITPYMVELVNSNQAIADKDMSVNIGDRDIAEANRRGEISLGLQLVTM